MVGDSHLLNGSLTNINSWSQPFPNPHLIGLHFVALVLLKSTRIQRHNVNKAGQSGCRSLSFLRFHAALCCSCQASNEAEPPFCDTTPTCPKLSAGRGAWPKRSDWAKFGPCLTKKTPCDCINIYIIIYYVYTRTYNIYI